MQDTFEKIFNIAIKDVPNNHFVFSGEEAVIYRGFKISKTKRGYKWQDTRYSDFYEVVDPKVTENVLEKGFSVTLTEVMLHSDRDKVLVMGREIEEKDSLIAHWAKESTRLWTDYSRKRNNINKDIKTEDEVKRVKKASLKKRYEKKKALYQKKRRVITEEREDLKADLKFFESRLKLYNN